MGAHSVSRTGAVGQLCPVCAHVCLCVLVCVYSCVHMCARVCMWVCVSFSCPKELPTSVGSSCLGSLFSLLLFHHL